MLRNAYGQYSWKPARGVKESILTVICLMFFGLWILEKTRPAIVSPLSDNPIVYANEPDISYTKQVQYIRFLRALAGRNSRMLERVVWCESGFWPRAVNTKTGDYGLLQISLSSHKNRIPGITDIEKIVWLKNPINNIMFGYLLFQEQGLSPWESSRSCWSK